ncbi:hypothetical protein CRUP_003902 [Coryphaenoides rupestris]|nr:hypothetical protein CRUP_003902 [Coryphaenoides rupestris]
MKASACLRAAALTVWVSHSQVGQNFSFVLTDIDSMQRFGFCRLNQGCRICICLLSGSPPAPPPPSLTLAHRASLQAGRRRVEEYRWTTGPSLALETLQCDDSSR